VLRWRGARDEVVAIAVGRSGAWILCRLVEVRLRDRGSCRRAAAGGGGRLVVAFNDDEVAVEQPAPIDVIFPVLNGPFGENGSAHALAELPGVSYVGANVFASAAAMDKDAHIRRCPSFAVAHSGLCIQML
jgi:D-alanine-D-alanine ligase